MNDKLQKELNNNQYYLFNDDCIEAMKQLEDNSVDSIVTDPPYGLGFMGKKWDALPPSLEVFEQCLRVLKPGGHLLAFGGSRTYHRLAVAVEDAGFDIRDQIMWVYSSGFPKSQNVSKFIDKKLGAEREVIGPNKFSHLNGKSNKTCYGKASRPDEAAPATDEAKQWEGWGTALKPSIEPLVVASKPFDEDNDLHTIKINIDKLEAQLWSLLLALTAELNSTSNQKELDEALSIAQWSAEKNISILDDLKEVMGMSQLESVMNISLNTVLSWKTTWEDVWKHGNTYTTKTKSKMITDLKTLKFCLFQIIQDATIKEAIYHGGLNVSVNNAIRYFNAELLKLSATLELFAVENAISKDHQNFRAVDDKVKHEPIVVARKPVEGTVVNNVLKYGTGGINIDECRVGYAKNDDPRIGKQYEHRAKSGLEIGKHKNNAEGNPQQLHNNTGRFPANLILSWPEDEYVLREDVTSEQLQEIKEWLDANTK